MTIASADENKKIYSSLHDCIIEKRFHAVSPIRRYAHRMQYQAFVDVIPSGATVLDAGSGEGVLSVLLAKKGCTVTGVDLSEPNIEASKKYAQEQGVADSTTFIVGDAENLPADDNSFDYVVSSHVLEHLPDFDKGAREIARVASKGAVIAIPTCLNLCALVLLGQDKYWTFSRKTPFAVFIGFFRVILAFCTGKEGVNEGYSGHTELIHIWRFPARAKRRLQRGGFRIRKYRASSLVMPYFSFLLPLTKVLEYFKWCPIIRNLGYGTTYVCELSS